MPFPRVAVFQPSTGVWVLNTDEGSPLPDVNEFDLSAPWIGAIGGDIFTVEEITVAGMIVELVSRFQDMVIDETGRGWPELYRAGTFIGLAQPAEQNSHIGWAILGQRLLPFGTLPTAQPLEVA